MPTKEDFQNEFSIITRKRSFTISARCELLPLLLNTFNTVLFVLDGENSVGCY